MMLVMAAQPAKIHVKLALRVHNVIHASKDLSSTMPLPVKIALKDAKHALV